METVKTIVVLARVTGVVVQNGENLPDTKGNDRTQNWANPVDPVVVGERSSSHTRTKSSSRENSLSELNDKDTGVMYNIVT